MTPPDIVVFAPLALELEVAKSIFDRNCSELPNNVAYGYSGQIGPNSVWLVRLNKGRDKAIPQATKVFTSYPPKLAITVGIAGGIEARGAAPLDVFLAERITTLTRGKSTSNTFSPSPDDNYVTDADLLFQISEIENHLGRDRLNLKRGHIGVTDAVIDDLSTDFSRAVLPETHDIDAVDMESSAIFAAAQSLPEDVPKPRLLVLRGISDTPKNPTSHSDGDIHRLPSGTAQRSQNAWKAQTKAVSAVRILIPHLIRWLTKVEIHKKPDKALETIQSWFESNVKMPNFPTLDYTNTQVLNALDTFYKQICVDPNGTPIVVSTLLELMMNSRTPQSLELKGPAGSGKTVLLRHLYQLCKLRQDQYNVAPVYVNLKQLSITTHETDLVHLQFHIENFVNEFCRDAAKRKKRPVIFVDGLYDKDHTYTAIEYSLLTLIRRHPSWSFLGTSIRRGVSFIDGSVAGKRQTDRDTIIYFKAVDTSNSDSYAAMINSMLTLLEQEKRTDRRVPSLQQVLQLTARLELLKVDAFLSSLCVRYASHDGDSISLSAIFDRFCGDFLKSHNLPDTDAAKLQAARTAYNLLTDERHIEFFLDAIEVDWLLATKHDLLSAYLVALHVMHEIKLLSSETPTPVRQIRQILLGYLYPETINRFAKEIMERPSTNQRQILEVAQVAITSAFTDLKNLGHESKFDREAESRVDRTVGRADPITLPDRILTPGQMEILQDPTKSRIFFDNAKIHFVYLIGRITRPDIREDAIAVLENLRKQMKPIHKELLAKQRYLTPRSEFKKTGIGPGLKSPKRVAKKLAKKNSLFKWDSTFGDFLMFARTIYISLAYMGGKDAANDYINQLLDDPAWNTLNRGFHMEYYGDLEYQPSVHMSKHDPGSSCNKTLDRLASRIKKKMSDSSYSLLSIEIFTYYSLLQVRLGGPHAAESNCASALELQKWMKAHPCYTDHVSTKVATFVDLICKHIEADFKNIFSLINSFYTLKTVLRQGWVRRDVRPGRIESVADHTALAAVLAFFLLPEKLADDDSIRMSCKGEYRKDDIVMMLLIHDLAESITGDIPTLDQNDKTRRDEVDFFTKMALSDSFGGHHGGRRAEAFWRRFEDPTDICGRIAKDMDKLECIFQLLRYRAENSIGEEAFRTMLDSPTLKVESDFCKSLLLKLKESFAIRM